MAPLTPQPKVAAGGIGSLVALVVVFIAGAFGLEVPTEVGVAFAGIISFAAAYIKTA